MEVENKQQIIAEETHFQIALRNNTSSDQAHAYVTGTSISRNALFFLLADGKTAYYPPNPANPGAPLGHDCAIKLGSPGSTTHVRVPHLEGARIYFAIGKLVFRLDPGSGSGPALVEPSETNPQDPNYDVKFGFAEFTWNSTQLFANISFVDFVGLPISLTLKTASGNEQHVSGIPSDGLDTICKKLQSVDSDGQDWAKLAIKSRSGEYLRALSPYQAMILHPQLFNGYYKDYVDKVWHKYQHEKLLVNTQAPFGVLSGHVHGGELKFGNESFHKPSTADIFSCSTGPFHNPTSGNAERLAIIPRLCAGFNRSTLLADDKTPDPDGSKDYYNNAVTNHYAKIVHEVTSDGKGYAFPYDDVKPDGGKDQSGKVSTGHPQSLVVTVGGHGA
ncbi:hypothetical protein BP6252_13140 [Coleophoma cylindrospora]|uniref:GH64 domain-containing protein n=1 Tax=Coleophoma cylindrospora TaxID=1849047 RepID=A0A3D8QB07_9HELO|nr:hypothetical protein BP6252_13140 [Coleophoma cylindrospora]